MDLTSSADILLLAGDILLAEHLTRGELSPYQRHRGYYDDFMGRAFAQYDHVVMIMGNHEHYKYDMTKSAAAIRAAYPGLHLLDNTYVDLGEFRIFGGTMWTDMGGANPLRMMEAEASMNDFKIIKNRYKKFSAQDSVVEHRKFMHALEQAYTPGMIVMSHHAPSYRSVADEYYGQTLNAAYATDLDQFIEDREISTWLHGHMHNSSDYMIGGTRVVCNPRGYHGHSVNHNFEIGFELLFLLAL
jgi:predicted phosphohydrolase